MTAADLATDLAALIERHVAAAAPRAPAYYSQNDAPIPRRTFLRLCRTGVLPHVRVGKLAIVRASDFAAWFDSEVERGRRCEVTPAEASPDPDPRTARQARLGIEDDRDH